MTRPDASPIEIRPAFSSDLEILIAIDYQCFPAGIAYSREELAALLSSAAVVTLVAQYGHQIAGFACLSWKRVRQSAPSQLQGELITIDVLPQWRRKGIGRKLYQALEMEFRGRGGVSIALHVAVDNEAAIGFYRDLQYRVTGRVPRYYLESVDAWRMKKPLLEA